MDDIQWVEYNIGYLPPSVVLPAPSSISNDVVSHSRNHRPHYCLAFSPSCSSTPCSIYLQLIHLLDHLVLHEAAQATMAT
jgi:hypothetical protein